MFLIGFLALMLLLAQMTVITTSITTSSQESIVRLDARGGKPGKPGNPPDDPTDPPVDPTPQTYELFIEIDYMVGHEPTAEVLNYIQDYYAGNNPSGDVITVTFFIADTPVTFDSSVSSTEFWNIEKDYNNDGDDKYSGDFSNFVSKWKWVLFGTTVEGEPNTFGYASVIASRKDLLAGNYIYIADETADNWATTELEMGTEAVVLMHELGHGIGIAKIHPAFGEQYDPDSGSVMSYISEDNAGQEAWYYSDSYWATNNLGYYAVEQ
ncbi:hypothetical protein ACFLRN_09790 [Thermoproteota archaeon]